MNLLGVFFVVAVVFLIAMSAYVDPEGLRLFSRGSIFVVLLAWIVLSAILWVMLAPSNADHGQYMTVGILETIVAIGVAMYTIASLRKRS